MSQSGNRSTAQKLIAVHGLRARAVVNERIAESRHQGNASGLARWLNVDAAISRLRRDAAPSPANRIGWGGRDRTSV